MWEPKEVLRSTLLTPEATDEEEGPREPHEMISTRESLWEINLFNSCTLTRLETNFVVIQSHFFI